MKVENGRIALTLTPRGIDTIAFLSADKDESLRFYQIIQTAIEELERTILVRANREEELGQ